MLNGGSRCTGKLAGVTIEPDAFQRRVDLVEGLFAEVGDAQQIGWCAIQQIANGEDALFLKAIGSANGQTDFRSTHFQLSQQIIMLLVS